MNHSSRRNQTRSPVTLTFAFIALSVASWSCGPGHEEMIQKAKRLDAQFEEAFNNEDLERVMASYWDDPQVVFMPADHMMVTGPDDIRGQFEAFFEGTNVKRFRMKDRRYQVHGDVIVGWGTFKLTTVPSLGPEVTIGGRYTEVIGKRDGKWVYLHDHASIPMSPNDLGALTIEKEPAEEAGPASSE